MDGGHGVRPLSGRRAHAAFGDDSGGIDVAASGREGFWVMRWRGRTVSGKRAIV